MSEGASRIVEEATWAREVRSWSTTIARRDVPEQRIVSDPGATGHGGHARLRRPLRYGELYGYLGRSGVTPSGEPFVIYHSFGPDGVDAEVCVPVTVEVASTDRIASRVLPAADRRGDAPRRAVRRARRGVQRPDRLDRIARPRGRRTGPRALSQRARDPMSRRRPTRPSSRCPSRRPPSRSPERGSRATAPLTCAVPSGAGQRASAGAAAS